MENQLIQLYLLVCHIYDTHSETCFQRLSYNSEPRFTDQELVTIYLFGHLNEKYEKKAMHKLIDKYWCHFFPRLPAYQTFVARRNQLEQTFQTIGGYFQELLQAHRSPEIDHLIDSVPVMLAAGTHAYAARGARDVAAVGYCASQKTYSHGVRLHTIAHSCFAPLPRPTHIWLREGSVHDLQSVREQDIYLPESALIGDKAFLDPTLQASPRQQQTRLYTPLKKPKGIELTAGQKYYNRLESWLRQPIESFFNWLIDNDGYSKSRDSSLDRRLNDSLLGETDCRFLPVCFQPLIHIILSSTPEADETSGFSTPEISACSFKISIVISADSYISFTSSHSLTV